MILAKAYLAAEVNGIFMETHPNCQTALCDVGTMFQTSRLKEFFNELV